jgi:hypothetical protein
VLCRGQDSGVTSVFDLQVQFLQFLLLPVFPLKVSLVSLIGPGISEPGGMLVFGKI